MTLDNLKIRLSFETDPSMIKIIEDKIARKMLKPKYAHLNTPPSVEPTKPKEKKDGKKSKG